MMRLPVFLLTIILALTNDGFGQKLRPKTLSFDYVQKPLEPIPGAINGTGKIVADHQAHKEMLRKAYLAELAQEEELYRRALVAWEEEKIRIDRAYQRQLEVYNKKTVGTKVAEQVLLSEGPPVKPPYPPVPIKRVVPQPYYPMQHNVETLSSQYTRISGYGNGNDKAYQLTVRLGAFQLVDEWFKEIIREEEHNDVRIEVVYYCYKYTYRYPISYQLKDANGNIMHQQAEFDHAAPKPGQTRLFDSPSAAHHFWLTQRNEHLQQLEGAITIDRLRLLNHQLNERHGVLTKRHSLATYLPKKKRYDYSEFYRAHQAAQQGYHKIHSDLTAAKLQLGKAVSIWERAYNEYSPYEKKARINEKVAATALIQMAEAQLWAKSYSASLETLNKLGQLKKGRRFASKASRIRRMIEDHRARDQANAIL